MRVVRESTVDAVVATFLAAEIRSPRFGARVRTATTSLGVDIDLVKFPDLADPMGNALRKRVLAECRGFPDREVFTGVPEDTSWQDVMFTPADLDSIRYINWDWWLQVTGGSRPPADALPFYDQDRQCRAIVAAIIAGRMPAPIIVVGRPGPSDLVVLEGHLRLTAMLLARAHLPPELPALLGISSTMNR